MRSYLIKQCNKVIQKSTTKLDFENRAKCLLYKNVTPIHAIYIYKIFVAEYFAFMAIKSYLIISAKKLFKNTKNMYFKNRAKTVVQKARTKVNISYKKTLFSIHTCIHNFSS